ncbi:MAG: oligopeptide:H+ symporter [Flavobacteriales bacterium]|nr:oligopeptide:H+ symporter [Flavobacteriales bacterium]
MSDQSVENMFKSKVLGHPAGLFVLFFTEMWERFSFYGMRVLLVSFLTMAVVHTNAGWEWTQENALALFGTYASLLYITPIAGGWLADKKIGYRWAVVLGALIMTLGHFAMAFETEFSLYVGLALLVIGTGFFKPNITSIISEMYKDVPQKKDGAFTIFYMGVNGGAFFGMLLCGYIAEEFGWSYGFGLAGIFMLFGLIQFSLAKKLFGNIGAPPAEGKTAAEEVTERAIESGQEVIDEVEPVVNKEPEKRNPFTITDKILTFISVAMGLIYIINDPMSKIAGINIIPKFFEIPGKDGEPPIMDASITFVIIGVLIFLVLCISRIVRYERVVQNRMWAVILFAFFTVFFWMSFEQGAGSLVIFARDFTDRIITGNAATAYFVIDTILKIGPLVIITWVLYRLFKETWREIKVSNIVLALSFVGVWAVTVMMINREMSKITYDVKYQAYNRVVMDKDGNPKMNKETGEPVTVLTPIYNDFTDDSSVEIFDTVTTVITLEELKTNQVIDIRNETGSAKLLNEAEQADIHQKVIDENKKLVAAQSELSKRPKEELTNSEIVTLEKAPYKSEIFRGTIVGVSNATEIKWSWFSILNSFFIIAFASFFSKWWESKYNIPAAFKYGLGLIIMAIGFGLLAYGARVIPQGAEAGAVRVGMIWLVLAYLFHTLGELCLSPMGLSYVSKLVPQRMIAFMFGMWYIAIAIGNKAAASLGGMVESIQEEYSMSAFFLIFTFIPAAAGIIVMLLHPLIKKLMGGVE